MSFGMVSAECASRCRLFSGDTVSLAHDLMPQIYGAFVAGAALDL